MKVLIDTNIIIDCLTERNPYFTNSKEVLRVCLSGAATIYMATHTVNDVYYIVHKGKPDLPHEKLVEAIVAFTKTLEPADLTAVDVESASLLQFSDFEDSLISQCAVKIKADYIITRNVGDFGNSAVKAITPQEFLKLDGIKR